MTDKDELGKADMEGDGDAEGTDISEGHGLIVARAVMVIHADADICVTVLSAEAVRVSYAVVLIDGKAEAEGVKVTVLVDIV